MSDETSARSGGVQLSANLRTFDSLEARLDATRATLGGSDMPHLMGVPCPGGPKGAMMLWLEKNPAARERVGLEALAREESRQHVNFAARQALEPLVLDYLGDNLPAGESLWRPSFPVITDPARPWAHQSPDALIRSTRLAELDLYMYQSPDALVRLTSPALAVGEAKTVHPLARHKWGAEPDLYAIVQVHQAMLLCGATYAYVAAYVGYGDGPEERLFYRVERNDDLIGEMVAVGEAFWRHVQSDTPPPPEGFEATTRAIRLLYPGKTKADSVVVTLPAAWAAKQREYERVAAQLEQLERSKMRLRQEIENEAGRLGATELIVPASQEYAGARWLRREITVKPRTCKSCGAETQKGYAYTRFEER